MENSFENKEILKNNFHFFLETYNILKSRQVLIFKNKDSNEGWK